MGETPALPASPLLLEVNPGPEVNDNVEVDDHITESANGKSSEAQVNNELSSKVTGPTRRKPLETSSYGEISDEIFLPESSGGQSKGVEMEYENKDATSRKLWA